MKSASQEGAEAELRAQACLQPRLALPLVVDICPLGCLVSRQPSQGLW